MWTTAVLIHAPEKCHNSTSFRCEVLLYYIHSWNTTHFGDTFCELFAVSPKIPKNHPLMLNLMPREVNGVVIVPRTLITGVRVRASQLRLQFGDYVIVKTKKDTKECIAF